MSSGSLSAISRSISPNFCNTFVGEENRNSVKEEALPSIMSSALHPTPTAPSTAKSTSCNSPALMPNSVAQSNNVPLSPAINPIVQLYPLPPSSLASSSPTPSSMSLSLKTLPTERPAWKFVKKDPFRYSKEQDLALLRETRIAKAHIEPSGARLAAFERVREALDRDHSAWPDTEPLPSCRSLNGRFCRILALYRDGDMSDNDPRASLLALMAEEVDDVADYIIGGRAAADREQPSKRKPIDISSPVLAVKRLRRESSKQDRNQSLPESNKMEAKEKSKSTSTSKNCISFSSLTQETAYGVPSSQHVPQKKRNWENRMDRPPLSLTDRGISTAVVNPNEARLHNKKDPPCPSPKAHPPHPLPNNDPISRPDPQEIDTPSQGIGYQQPKDSRKLAVHPRVNSSQGQGTPHQRPKDPRMLALNQSAKRHAARAQALPRAPDRDTSTIYATLIPPEVTLGNSNDKSLGVETSNTTKPIQRIHTHIEPKLEQQKHNQETNHEQRPPQNSPERSDKRAAHFSSSQSQQISTKLPQTPHQKEGEHAQTLRVRPSYPARLNPQAYQQMRLQGYTRSIAQLPPPPPSSPIPMTRQKVQHQERRHISHQNMPNEGQNQFTARKNAHRRTSYCHQEEQGKEKEQDSEQRQHQHQNHHEHHHQREQQQQHYQQIMHQHHQHRHKHQKNQQEHRRERQQQDERLQHQEWQQRQQQQMQRQEQQQQQAAANVQIRQKIEAIHEQAQDESPEHLQARSQALSQSLHKAQPEPHHVIPTRAGYGDKDKSQNISQIEVALMQGKKQVSTSRQGCHQVEDDVQRRQCRQEGQRQQQVEPLSHHAHRSSQSRQSRLEQQHLQSQPCCSHTEPRKMGLQQSQLPKQSQQQRAQRVESPNNQDPLRQTSQAEHDGAGNTEETEKDETAAKISVKLELARVELKKEETILEREKNQREYDERQADLTRQFEATERERNARREERRALIDIFKMLATKIG